jgi:hypothetical protein
MAHFVNRKNNRFTTKSEFFLDSDGVLYRSQVGRRALLVVPETLIERIIPVNHDSIFASHPGRVRTDELIELKHWWPKMRQTVEDCVMRCDMCHRRKGGHEFRAPLGDVEEPTEPFQVTSMGVSDPYPLTPRKNKYLSLVRHFTKHAEAFPIPDQTGETCARVHAIQIITRHGSGSTPITDQGRAFVSDFFKGNLPNFEFPKSADITISRDGKRDSRPVPSVPPRWSFTLCNVMGTNRDIVVPYSCWHTQPHSIVPPSTDPFTHCTERKWTFRLRTIWELNYQRK